MSMKRTDQAQTWLPTDFGEMLNRVVASKSVAAQASTPFSTDKQKVGFPLFVANPSVGWYSELDEITPADGDTDEVVIEPKKTAGLTLLSNELADDSDPAIADQIGSALADQIAKAIDVAYFANTTAKSYGGLLSKSYTAVDSAGPALTNLDKFVSARYAAEAHGAKLTHWLIDPSVAEALSLLKKLSSGSNESLLQFVEDGITIAGLPVITTTDVDAATLAWGVDRSQQRLVTRKGTSVERFESITNDGKWVRAISRIGWDTLNPAGIVRIWDATP
jgi:HK97 family phage major capsid protein